MSEETARTIGQVVLDWWGRNLRPPDDTGSARALRAKLRRADGISQVLAQRQVVELYNMWPGNRFLWTVAAVAQAVAHVERHDKLSFARALGGGDAVALSSGRFQKLIRSKNREELVTNLRRALPMIGHACNVATLAEDIAYWGEKTQANWCFDYFGGERPDARHAEEESK